MAKRKTRFNPWPENAWCSAGMTDTAMIDRIRALLPERRDRGQVAHFREWKGAAGHHFDLAFDASYRTGDGAAVKARLHLELDDGPSLLAQMLGRPLEEDHPTRTAWSVTALADRPWRLEWPTPAEFFFPDDDSSWLVDHFTGKLPLYTALTLEEELLTSSRFIQTLERMSEKPWYAVVFTHEPEHLEKQPDLLDMLPPGARSRVLDIRLQGSQDWMVNEILGETRVHLPMGGGVIVPAAFTPDGWSTAKHSIRAAPGGVGDTLREVASRVTEYLSLPMHQSDHVREELRGMESWVLPELPVGASLALDLQAEAKADAERARGELERTLKELRAEQDLRRQAEKRAEAAAREAELLRSDPVRERLAEVEAERDSAWEGYEAAERQADDLVQTVGWLRRQLAQVPGRSYGEEAPARPAAPESWEEMFELVELMPHIALGDLQPGLNKIRGHQYEGLWRRRTWECLEALEAYAEAKEKVGVSMLPHFASYLVWEQADTMIPATWHVPGEALLQRSDTRWRGSRLFEAEGLGEVFMGEHFRVGGVRPPAPRMHVYDDTAGATGKVHVGYLGPHLKNHAGR
ncbi:hypothetical protein [Streptomyces albidoflavus]|uniref:hypothetical protein n=1 Tax=Streptomyces albidoflavus TaxID=1886 RepID=UPI0033F44188